MFQTAQKSGNLEVRSLKEYVQSQTTDDLKRFYNYPAICLAVYRELSDIARQFVIRILFVDQPVPQAVIASWVSQQYAKDQNDATASLTQLGIWRETAIVGGLSAWELAETFKCNLKCALQGGGQPWPISRPQEKDAKPRDVAFLDTYAMARWRCVLHYMVGSNANPEADAVISPDAVRILLGSNLMKREERGDSTTITRQGFQFLLLDTQAQIWYFMLYYLDTCEAAVELSKAECLSMLFQLSFSTLGRDYSSEGLSPNMQKFLQHLREFGLVFQRKRKEGRFYPTRLVLNITKNDNVVSSAIGDGTIKGESGYIIVETNYRVYAYTDSPLQIAILALFTEMLYRFPNLAIGVLTRDSVRQALRGGISAEQIISYLEQHAHKNMKAVEHGCKMDSTLPPTVVDQIKLWELELKRLKFTEGTIFSQFQSQLDFNNMLAYAKSSDALVHYSEKNRSMVVTKSATEDVKRYWKRYMKS